jgi:uncharacterized Zn-finger protein
MATVAKSRKTANRADDMVGAAARIACAGTVHGFDRIVAAGRHIRQAARDAVPPALRWSSARQRELEHALERWDNEGGALSPDHAIPAARFPAPLSGFPRYLNDIGVREIRIGVTEFHCIGALPPHDHPHIYLNMKGSHDVLCPYCSTTYVFDERLREDETKPAGCLYVPLVSEMSNLSDICAIFQ